MFLFYFILFPFVPLPRPKHKQSGIFLCENLLLPTQDLDCQGQVSLLCPLTTLWGLAGESPVLAASPSRRRVTPACRGCVCSSAPACSRHSSPNQVCVSVKLRGCSLSAELVPEPGAESPIPSLALMVLPLGLNHLPFF